MNHNNVPESYHPHRCPQWRSWSWIHALKWKGRRTRWFSWRSPIAKDYKMQVIKSTQCKSANATIELEDSELEDVEPAEYHGIQIWLH